MKNLSTLTVVFILAVTLSLAIASDPSPLQDFCVSTNSSSNGVFVNGKFCKDPNLVTANDFYFTGLQNPRPITNPIGSIVTPVSVNEVPGLNTLGISSVRFDYAIHGQNPPHIHPRATELFLVAQGTLFVGFITSNPDSRLFTKTLNAGDLFVFPKGLIHFQVNIGHSPAVAFAGLSSQNPGTIFIVNSLFGSNPRINPSILAKAFQLDSRIVTDLLTKFKPKV